MGLPAYGRRLVPQVLDELATADPERVYAALPRQQMSDVFETITYIGMSDLRGIVTLLAAVKTGYKLLVPSPRNPPSVNCHLMNQTGSKRLLYAAELAPLLKPLQALVPTASSDAVPSLQVMLDSRPEQFPYTKSFEEARYDPIVVLHSSGSTGLPKPITITHGSVGAHDNDHNLPAPAGRKKMDTTVFMLDGEERRLYLILPFYHLWSPIEEDHAILNNLTLVLGPSHIAPDATMLKEVVQRQKLRAIMVVPTILEQFLHDTQGIDLLKGLDFVACAGAPLPSSVGDRVTGIVKLYIFIGSTETFPLPELVKSPQDWQYHEFNPSLKHEMRPYDANTGTFELIILADDTTQDKAPVYHNLPGENPFYTKDLFTRHPTKPTLYKYYGRRDDIIVFANGEKVNPILLEQHIQGDPSLKGVLLIGSGRVLSALIVEPRESLDHFGRAQLLEALWPRIEKTIRIFPAKAVFFEAWSSVPHPTNRLPEQGREQSNTGYGQSKLAAERILVAASRRSGVAVSIVRVGQVGGSSSLADHVWADQPWISAIIRTSKTLGLFPSPVAPVDWIPVDDLATILENVILHQPASDSEIPEFFNVVSEGQSWNMLIDVLRGLDPTMVSEIVSLPDWVNRLRQLSDSGSADVAKLPALRLLDFYEGLGSGSDSLDYVTEHTSLVSGMDLAPLEHELLACWLKTWILQWT
ncbi:hypothetical protein VMCG_10544 [Cytospora schulzeri]|uniref:AMP-dependent synthetase/ligase domain-containing protein n=1 Tax=Cytospora schulzeri TaxID=448051 RepID=A0A423VAD9_9PEZI|nr:hypothetical protein VMCG_10544 [Valsa malicola]